MDHTPEDRHARLIELNRELIKRRRERTIQILSVSTMMCAVLVVLGSMLLCSGSGKAAVVIVGGVMLLVVVAPLVLVTMIAGVGVDRQSRKQLRYLEGGVSSPERAMRDEESTVAELEAERQAILLEINSGRSPDDRREGGVSIHADERARGALSVDGEGEP